MSAQVYFIWPGCVYIKLEKHRTERVSGPSTALRALDQWWPAERGHHYYTAKAACSAAMLWKCTPVLARETFIAAAIEANILIGFT